MKISTRISLENPTFRVNVWIYRGSQISSEKIPPKQSFKITISRNDFKTPRNALDLEILEKLEDSQKKVPFLFVKLVRLSNKFKETVRARRKINCWPVRSFLHRTILNYLWSGFWQGFWNFNFLPKVRISKRL